MSREEITGVIAHELGHVKHRDTLIMTVAATLAGALTQLANFALFFGGGRREDGEGGHPLAGLIGILVAPFAAMLIQMAISRSREFLADEASAQFTGNPMALANGLRKLEGWKAEVPMHHGSPATAHLFIVNPFTAGGLASLFSTHPSTKERIARLEELARSGGLRPA